MICFEKMKSRIGFPLGGFIKHILKCRTNFYLKFYNKMAAINFIEKIDYFFFTKTAGKVS